MQISIKKNLYILIILYASIQAGSCKKGEKNNKLPAATNSGQNIIAGYIDDELFISRRADWLSRDPSVIYYSGVPELAFGGKSILQSEGPSVGFTLRENLHIGQIVISPGGRNTGLLLLGSGDENRYFSESGRIDIKRFDTVARIYSGTFDVEFQNSSGKKVRFREGRFDLKAFE